MRMDNTLIALTKVMSLDAIQENYKRLGFDSTSNEDFKPNNKTPLADQRYEWKKRIHPIFKDLMTSIANDKTLLHVLDYKNMFVEAINNKGVTNAPFVNFILQCTMHDCLFLSMWAKYKQIYKFDKTTLEMLKDTQYEKVPTKVFDNLPYQSFYLDAKFTKGECVYDGCYVSIMVEDDNKRRLGFDFVANNQEGYMSYGFIPIDDGDKSIEEYFADYQVDTDIVSLIKEAIPLVLYLCSVNKDIEVIKVTGKNQIKKRKEYIASGCTETKVGYKLGASISKTRHLYTYEHKASKGTGSSKTPHFRKAHYHHYWIGARDSEDRQLIVKFVEPMFINANDKEKLSTIHKVK